MKDDKHKHMHCDEVTNLLVRWSDGELDARRGDAVRGHLLDCLVCRARYGEHRNLERWIVADAAPAVPMGFGARVARMASERAAQTGGRPLDVSDLAAGPTGVLVRELDTLVPKSPFGRGSSASNATNKTGEGSIFAFVLACTAAAAAALLVLSLVLGGQERPSGEELRADPLPEVLRSLEDLKHEEGAASSAEGVRR